MTGQEDAGGVLPLRQREPEGQKMALGVRIRLSDKRGLSAIEQYCQNSSPFALTVYGCLVVLLIGIVDYWTGTQIALSVFYLIPISVVAWCAGKRSGLLISLIGAGTWFAAEAGAGAVYSHPAIPFWNAFTRLSIFTLVVCLLSAIRQRNEKLEEKVRDRTAQLTAEIAERNRAERVLSVQYEATRVLVESASWIDAKGKILEKLCGGLDWDYGAIWMIEPNRERRCEATWGRDGMQPFESEPSSELQGQRTELLSRVIAQRSPAGMCELPHERFRSVFAFPILAGDAVLGAVEFLSRRVHQPDEEWLVSALGNQIGRFLEHTQAEQDIIQISHEERQRIANDLHDGICQYLSGIAFKAKRLADSLAAKKTGDASDAAEIVKFINNAVGQVRDLARGLDPLEIAARGLVSALERLAFQIEDAFRIPCIFRTGLTSVPLDPPACLHLYRIVQEATSNAIRHGHARRLEIELAASGSHLRLTIRDDGNGFVPGNVPGGMGLRVMLHRAHVMGGTLAIDSQPARGTQISCVVPNPAHSASTGSKNSTQSATT